MSVNTHLTRWPVAAAVLLLCAGCLDAGPQQHQVHAGSSGSGSASAAPSAGPDMADHRHAAEPAADLRLTLEQLLGHHAILMVRLMRGPIDREPTFVTAARGALDRNTDELVAAVDQADGHAAGSRFRTLWQQHVSALEDYSTAVASDDAAAKSRALSTLTAYSRRYGDLIEEATRGRLRSAAVTENVAEHIRHMVEATDAYAEGNYPRAYKMERMAYAAMFATGKSLAGATVQGPAGEMPASFTSPSEDLRSGLGQLLGEHVELAFDATRAVVAGQPAAKAAAAALYENTQAVLAAMSGAVGDQAAAAFGDVAAAHIDALVAFAIAVADDDDLAQARARARLDAFPQHLSGVLTPLSHGNVAADTVIQALRTHDQQLLQQVTAYAANDYPTAHTLAYAGYEHMFAVAQTLADVLAGQTAATAPRGGAATGAGGMARR